MAKPITLEQLQNASADAQTLETVLNGGDNTDVTSRLGEQYPTVAKALKTIDEKFQAVVATEISKQSANISVLDYHQPAEDGDNHTNAFKRALEYAATLPNAVISLSPGEYKLTEKIIIKQSNLIIDGNGATIIWDGTVGGTLYDGVFEFTGELTTTKTTVAQNANVDSSFISVADASGFVAGDYVLIKSTTSNIKPHRFINQVYRISNISSNTLLLDTPIGVNFVIDTYPIEVTKVNTVHGSQIINVNFVAKNQTSRSVGISAVQMIYTSACVARVNAEGFWFKAVSWHYSTSAMCSVKASKPAAVDGGEGYGIQFAFCTNSIAHDSWGHELRHLFDATASFGITAVDMFDTGSASASYNLHSMCEYDVKFINCRSNGSKQYGFGLGSYSFTGAIGIWSNRISLTNCTVKDSVSIAVKATSAGGDYMFKDCHFRTLGTTNDAFSVVVSNANVTITDCDLPTGLYVLRTEETKNDGFVKVTGSTINRNGTCIQMGEGTQLSLYNCTIGNYWRLLGECDLDIYNSTINVMGNHFVTSNQYTHNITIANSTIKMSGANNALYILQGKTLKIDGCRFIATNNIGLRLYSQRTIINNCTGALRFTSDAADVIEVKNNNLELDSTFTNAITINNTKAAIEISNNRIKFYGTNTVSINASNTPISIKYIDNTIDGNVAISATSAKGFFVRNIASGTSQYPSATATRIVRDNV